MKKLSKIKLHEATVLNDSEMKMVFGGSGAGGDGSCSYTCGGKTESITCPGDCVEIENGVKCVYNGQDWGKIQCLTSGSN